MSNDHLDVRLDGHNASPQTGVDRNPDPALDLAREHRHEHTHHGGLAAADKDRLAMHDDIAYSAGTTDKGRDIMDTPPQDYDAHKMNDAKAAEKSVSDEESGGVGGVSNVELTGPGPVRRFYRRFRPFFHVFFFLFLTSWFITGLFFHRHDTYGWLKPFLFWLALSLRLLTCWVPAAWALKPLQFVWKYTVSPSHDMIPAKLRQPLAGAGTIAVFLVGSLVPAETGDNTRVNRLISLIGLSLMILFMWAFSRDRRHIAWHTVIGGMLSQFIIALFVLRTQVGFDIFDFISFLARTLLSYAADGVAFLTDEATSQITWFFFSVIPAIIFFVSIVSVLFYLGFMQWFIGKFAVFFFFTLRVSGAEAVVAAATPFIGQGESAMLIRPFVPHLTMAELHQVMTCGFATIAGSVLSAYIGMGLPAQVLVSSCIMSIPASLAISKLRYPETEETLTSGRTVVPEDEEDKAANALHAFANGTWLGLKIAGMIVATLLCIIAFVAMLNAFLGWFGTYYGIGDGVGDTNSKKLSLELILGYLLWPVSFFLGVPLKDVYTVAQFIGMKIITNEFVAFKAISEHTDLSARGKVIATYACCGFGNIGSLGNQIGVLSQVAPGRSADVSRVAVSALVSGIIATLSSAAVAGMLYTDAIGNGINTANIGS